MKELSTRRSGAPRRTFLQDATMMWLLLLLAFLILVGDSATRILLDRWNILPDLLRSALNPIVLLGASFNCLYLSKRYSARMAGPSAATHLMKEDPRPPVLYLRSFKADHKEGTPRWLQAETQEEKITSVFSRIGPPVALGDPKEKGKFPTLGIPRDYVEGSWEKIVENLLARARLVVVRAGTTTSLIDEVSWAKRALKPERLLIIVPSGRKNYEAFRSQVKDYAHRPLPEYPSWQTSRTRIKGLICFEPDGTARFLTFKRSFLRGSVLNPLPRALQATLRPVYERLGIPWRPSSINWVRVLLLGLLVLTLLYVLNEKIRSYPI